MSLNSSQTLTIGGQDLMKNGSRIPREDARAVLKPSTPTKKPQPVSISAVFPHALSTNAAVTTNGKWTL